MRNILDFQEYREQVRIYEAALVKEQIMEPLEEGLFKNIRKKINQKATLFVRQALADEIEMGKKLNEEIQEAVKELKKYIDKLQEFVDENGPDKSELFKRVENIFNDIHKASFDLLEIISGVEINFADYIQNATMATFVNFGVLFIPTRSTFLLKKSYKYFIGIIKNTIRRDMLMLMLNFDQFENTVLIQSLEDDEQSKMDNEVKTKLDAYTEFATYLLGSDVGGGKKRTMSKAEVDRINKARQALRDGITMQMKMNDRRYSSIGFDTRYDNTYTKTLDQLKSFVLEDDSKYLEAIKAGMRAQALDEVDTKSFVELLISAAEECAYEVSNAIHTNFIEKVSVFKLANQKTLIDLIKKDKAARDKEAEKKRKEEEDELRKMEKEDTEEAVDALGEDIFKKVTDSRDGEEQVKAFKKLWKTKHKDKEYDERYILESWLSKNDGGDFKNWKDNEEQITDLLKTHIDIVCNDKSYKAYADILVECLLPCAVIDWTDFEIDDIIDLKKVEKVKKVEESIGFASTSTEIPKMSEETTSSIGEFTVEYSESEKEAKKKGSEYVVTLPEKEKSKDGEKKVEYVKKDDDNGVIKIKSAFSVLKLKEEISRFMLFYSICKDGEGTSVVDEYKGVKITWEKYNSNEERIEVWREALELISENLVKLETDVIIEVLENLFNNMLRTKYVTERTLKKIVEKLEKLEKLKENEYLEESDENSPKETKAKES